MPAKKYHVELTDAEHTKLEQMLRRGKHSARRLTRGRILLKAADGLRDDEIAEAVKTVLLQELNVSYNQTLSTSEQPSEAEP